MNAKQCKADFPLLLGRLENGKPLTYLDNGATTQKPWTVLNAMTNYLETTAANPHRGAYALSAEATECYEQARASVARFIGAGSSEEIVFTKNASESLNLVALSYGAARVGPDDEILISISEHHSNLLPWQALARRQGAKLVYLYPDQDGFITVEEVRAKLNERTRIVALTQISNVLGVENPIQAIAALVHAAGAVLVVDGAQSVPHIPVNVRELDVDFLAFSGHKMLGPGGVGVLYGKAAHLAEMEPPYLGGGIVEEVTKYSVRLLPAPHKFEPGTPNVEAAVGLQAAIEYLESIGMEQLRTAEAELTSYLLARLQEVPELEIYGCRDARRLGIVAFNLAGVHAHDVASILDADGVTIRAGHHCAQPLLTHLGVAACCRASLYLYNTPADVDLLVTALAQVGRWLHVGPRRAI